MPENLTLDNLNLYYGKESLCGPVNCCFRRGLLNLIVGRAGAGKSTLLKMIAGFHKDFTGAVTLDGKEFEPAGNIALAFQNPESLFFNPSVNEEVCYALMQQKNIDLASVEQTGKNWLESWGLEPDKFWNKHPMELSGGEKRKVALSACTVLQPPVIMLDEPFAGLDFKGRKMIIDILCRLARDHIIILVTHDPEQLLDYSETVLFLRKNDCSSYTPLQFVKSALADSDFYPLPEWYSQSVKSDITADRLPLINATAVAAFLNGEKDDAYYLSSGR